jgi:hypothetical protein
MRSRLTIVIDPVSNRGLGLVKCLNQEPSPAVERYGDTGPLPAWKDV